MGQNIGKVGSMGDGHSQDGRCMHPMGSFVKPWTAAPSTGTTLCMISAVYFCNWSIYGRGYSVAQLPADALTHVLYAFAKTDPQSGTVSLSDPWADVDKKQDLGGKGCLGELSILKKKHRQLRVLLSIGGWTYSGDLTAAFASPHKIAQFARSAVQLVKEHGLDGLDVDWEYPADATQARQYVDVLARLRLELDSLALSLGLPRDQFDLSIAAPVGPQQRDLLRVCDMDRYLSFWNLMAYDHAGAWSQSTGHQANLYGGQFNTDDAIRFYTAAGVPAARIVLGMPLYGRSFAHTCGLGGSFKGVLDGKFENGIHDYKDLPLSGMKEGVDQKAVAAFCQGSGAFVSYDNQTSVRAKANYVRERGLAGGMWWEASGDRKEASLIRTFQTCLGPPRWRPNWIGS